MSITFVSGNEDWSEEVVGHLETALELGDVEEVAEAARAVRDAVSKFFENCDSFDLMERSVIDSIKTVLDEFEGLGGAGDELMEFGEALFDWLCEDAQEAARLVSYATHNVPVGRTWS